MDSSCPSWSLDEDTDSGLVRDYQTDSEFITEAFEVLPDERTLSFDEDLDLDLSHDNFGAYEVKSIDKRVFTHRTIPNSLTSQDITEMKPRNSLLSNTTSNHNTNGDHAKILQETIHNKSLEPSQSSGSKPCTIFPNIPGKRTEFSREEARLWRRKRILNSQTTKKSAPHHQHTCLKPLLPLPDVLKPLTVKKLANKTAKVTSMDKLHDPLLGGERIKTNKAPLPLKMRALPRSFWKEPQHLNTPHSLIGSHYSVLPPLFSNDNNTVEDIRPVTPPDEMGRSPRHKKKWVETGQPDIELLFSLFDHLDNTIDDKLIVKRGRPKKQVCERPPPPPSRDDDPCIVDALAEKLFPELSIQQAKRKSQNLSAIIQIGKEKRIELAACKSNQSYTQMLSELVSHM